MGSICAGPGCPQEHAHGARPAGRARRRPHSLSHAPSPAVCPSSAGAPPVLTHPLENLDPAQSVQVLPRHLAGPGSVDPRTVWAFPFEEGWPFAQTEAGTAAAFSPCLRLQTTFDPQPDKAGRGTWTINAHWAPFTPPAWRITFDATTPAEILHDVHSELLDLYLQDGDSAQDRLFQDGTPPYEA
nr:DUF317 domain-containing protein [Streptomyces coelicoflavus]